MDDVNLCAINALHCLMHMNNIKQEWEWFVAKSTSAASAQSASASLESVPDMSEKPNQPLDLAFPKRQFGKPKLSIAHSRLSGFRSFDGSITTNPATSHFVTPA